jgi:hypothetical protein
MAMPGSRLSVFIRKAITGSAMAPRAAAPEIVSRLLASRNTSDETEDCAGPIDVTGRPSTAQVLLSLIFAGTLPATCKIGNASAATPSMRSPAHCCRQAALVGLVALAPAIGLAQEPAAATEQRSTGLPSRVDWTFNLEAAWGGFGFANSLYEDPKEGAPVNLGDHWFEGFAKPKVSATYTLPNSSAMYGSMSVVGERTYGSAPELVGADFSSFGPEDLAIGWRSGDALTLGENALDLVVGRTTYTLGRGMLLWDGAAEGGSRGGYWSNARKSFALAGIARFTPGPYTLEAFYLKKDELPENETDTDLWGTNFEYRIGEANTFGVTYMKFWADAAFKPTRDGMDVFNLRAYAAPVIGLPELTVDFEYAAERNGDLLSSNAWNLQGAYELSEFAWKPTFSYRYAYFQGDDPATPKNENFDSLLTGFSDWGAWWQGEIAGEYFLSNSNLISNQVRAHLTPNDSISGGVMLYKFQLDQPGSYGAGLAEKDIAFELDAYTDWKINRNFTASFVAAFANPQAAVQESSGRTKNFILAMAYLAYKY